MEEHKALKEAHAKAIDEVSTAIPLQELTEEQLRDLEDHDLKEHEQHRLTLETWMRGVTLLAVVFALIGYPAWALISNIETQKLLDVMAPITGIAGAIVGYWFGQASRRIPTEGQPDSRAGSTGPSATAQQVTPRA